MGLMGGSKTYVSSVVYNMAGDLIDRPDYLKTAVVSNVISNSRFSMSETLSSAYLNGPGIKARSFHRWSKRPGKYDLIGVPTARILDESDVTPYLITSHIPVPLDTYASLALLRVAVADYSYWADAYMLAFHYTVFMENWTSIFDHDTGEIVITREDGVTQYRFTPSDFVPGETYVYATYNLRSSIDGDWIATQMWIYRIGSGNEEIDNAIAITSHTEDEFMTFIPVRIKREFLSSTNRPDLYAQAKAAYKKATGQKFDKLVEKIADNEDLEDIDRAYVVFGVCLNTQEHRSRRYLFTFFEQMLASSTLSWDIYNNYISENGSWAVDYAEWRELRKTWTDEHPGEPVPPPPPKPDDLLKPAHSIEIKSHGDEDAKLHLIVRWNAIRKRTGAGLGKPGAKKGDTWWDHVNVVAGDEFLLELGEDLFGEGIDNTTSDVEIFWQKDDDYWEAIQIIGLEHENVIKNGESVTISAYEALNDEDESGFIVPIHYDSLKAMSLIDSTQMMLSSMYIVFNCYKVVKQKWYQTWIFKIVLFVAMVAITVATMGATAPGLLGAAGAVGASLGFSGLMATIIGAVANAIAAMILMQVISVASTALFGAKLGAIIGTIASIAAMQVGSAMMSGQSLATAWGNMMSASNILAMTSSVGKGVAGYMAASAAEWQVKTQELVEDYEKASKAIEQQWIKEFGLGTFAYDPNLLTANNPMGLTELPQSFLDRTLLCGSDIADMTNGMLSDFASMTIDVSTIGS